jgi:hypothetical protein
LVSRHTEFTGQNKEPEEDVKHRCKLYLFVKKAANEDNPFYISARKIVEKKVPDLVAAYNELHQQLLDGGIKPVLQRLDNEISKVLTLAIKDKGIDFQLASPNDHRLNRSERAVQTFKNHLIAILYGCDRKFPVWLWCQIIPQVVMTLNMLRHSRINPRLSAHTQIFGIFDYN